MYNCISSASEAPAFFSSLLSSLYVPLSPAAVGPIKIVPRFVFPVIYSVNKAERKARGRGEDDLETYRDIDLQL